MYSVGGLWSHVSLQWIYLIESQYWLSNGLVPSAKNTTQPSDEIMYDAI